MIKNNFQDETGPGLSELRSRLKSEDNGLHGEIPPQWMQGRTAFGGIICSLALSAVDIEYPNLPPLRTMQCAFIGPVGSAPIFMPAILRQGQNVVYINVDVMSETKLAARISFVFGKARKSEIFQQACAQPRPEPADCEDFVQRGSETPVPRFFNRFETKLISGSRLMSGSAEASVTCWSRHKDPSSRQGLAAFVCVADALPPAALIAFTRSGPISSINWHVNFLTEDFTTKDGWWQMETWQTAASEGYSSQDMRYFNYHGQMVATAMQSVAVFL